MSPEWAEQAVPNHPHNVPGKILAERREALGLTVEQIADQLKLAVRQVVALEAGDYPSLPSPAVVRGFVRAYAKVVKLDAAPLVAMIELAEPTGSDTPESAQRRAKATAFSEVRFPSNGKRRGMPGMALGGALVLLALAAGAWHYGWLGGLPGIVAPLSGTPEASVTVLPGPLAGKPGAPGNSQLETRLVNPAADFNAVPSTSVPLVSVPPPTPSVSAMGAASTSGLTPAGVSPARPVEPVAPAAAATAPAAANALVIKVREDSWVELRSASGKALLSRLVRGGSTESFTLNEPLTLVVGKPDAVDVTLRGAQVALPTAPGGTISRINLK